MNRMQQDQRERQLRKAAILVASLDDATAERMLADLAPEDAQAIRLAVSRLGEIDPDEESDVLNQFRRGTRMATPRSTEGVELDASLLARLDEPSPRGCETTPVMSPAAWDSLSDAEAATIVEALTREHPQTVAVVISRLEPAAAAKILSQLSGPLQTDVLGRLAELDPADEHSLKVVESHLSQWITRQRERKQRLAAGVELVGRILQSTPPAERTVILTRLCGTNPELAERVSSPAPAPLAAPAPRAAKTPGPKKLFRRAANFKPAPSPPPRPEIADPLGELEQLDDATLMKTLTQVDRHVVTLALAGASEKLMKRVLGRLPRRHAKQVRRSLHEIGPTRLSDMFAAQQELAHQARQLQSR